MKPLLIFALLLVPFAQAQQPAVNGDESPLSIISSRYSRDRQPVENAASASSSAAVGPQPAPTRYSKNFEKQKRINASAGDRDPEADTLDSRSAEMDRITQQAREAESKPAIDGFAYQVKVQNGGEKVTQNVFWEYQFRETANPANVVRRQFICSVKIKPSQEKSLQAFSRLGPSEVIDVKTLGKKPEHQFESAVRINRIEFADGTFWQRKGWEVTQFQLSAKARSATRNLPMCRGL
jgi:hypothetical protein